MFYKMSKREFKQRMEFLSEKLKTGKISLTIGGVGITGYESDFIEFVPKRIGNASS
jgi:hypothetical protein